MMLEKYRTGVRAVNAPLANSVLLMLRVKRRRRGVDGLFRILDEAGFDQADLVLCLLRVNTAEALKCVEILIGRKIKQCPPALRWRAVPLMLPDRVGDQRRVLSVMENPTINGRRSWLRHYPMIKVGLTLAQLFQRGITTRDLCLVRKRGWVTIE